MNAHENRSAGRHASLLIPDETCWRIEPADRLSVIVDGADYFRHLRSALRSAERTIYMMAGTSTCGWT